MQTFTYLSETRNSITGVLVAEARWTITEDDSKIQRVQFFDGYTEAIVDVPEHLDELNAMLAGDGRMVDIQGHVFSVEIRNQVMKWMHYGSTDYIVTDDRSNKLWRDCYMLADGFGALPSLNDAERQGWDWSHVRDSSPQAIRQIHDHITKTLARWEREAEETETIAHAQALAKSIRENLANADIETLRQIARFLA